MQRGRYSAVFPANARPHVADVIRASFTMPEDVQEALRRMYRAMPRDYRTPCQNDPESWDSVALTSAGREETSAVAIAMVLAADACMDCQVFLLCRKVGEANRAQKKPPIVGVIAGELHDTSESGQRLRTVMEAAA